MASANIPKQLPDDAPGGPPTHAHLIREPMTERLATKHSCVTVLFCDVVGE
jgi:hypothetical protein